MNDVYRNLPIENRQHLLELCHTHDDSGRLFSGWVWLPIRTPAKFNYTSVIMFNDPFQGLLHSYLRRSDQWANLAPGLDGFIPKLKLIQDQMDKCRSAKSLDEAKQALGEFLPKMYTLKISEYNGKEEETKYILSLFNSFKFKYLQRSKKP